MRNDHPNILEGNLRDFFGALLVQKADEHGFQISQGAKAYVIELLVAYNETAQLFSQQNVKIPVMADMLAEALDADFQKRIRILRQMGDTSLMVTGYFPEALSRKSIDLSYYQHMGEIAYSHLSSLVDELNVYEELSDRFFKLSQLLNRISEETHSKDYSLPRLLEFYMSTGSEDVLDKLKKQGVIPLPKKKEPLF